MTKLFQKLITIFRSKIEVTTTASSFIALLVMLGSVILVEIVFKPIGLLFQIERIVCAFVLFFLAIKFRLIFLMKSKVNEKGIDVEKTFAGLRLKGFTIAESATITNNIVMLENSKHHKIIIREAVNVLSLAIILISLFLFCM